MFMIPFICHFFFLSNKMFHHRFHSFKRVRVFKVCLQTIEVFCVKENHNAKISFDFFFPFSYFPSLAPVQSNGKFVSKISQ